MHPRTERGTARNLRASLEERNRRVMIDGFGVHGPNEADLIGDGRSVRKQFAEPGA